MNVNDQNIANYTSKYGLDDAFCFGKNPLVKDSKGVLSFEVRIREMPKDHDIGIGVNVGAVPKEAPANMDGLVSAVLFGYEKSKVVKLKGASPDFRPHAFDIRTCKAGDSIGVAVKESKKGRFMYLYVNRKVIDDPLKVSDREDS